MTFTKHLENFTEFSQKEKSVKNKIFFHFLFVNFNRKRHDLQFKIKKIFKVFEKNFKIINVFRRFLNFRKENSPNVIHTTLLSRSC